MAVHNLPWATERNERVAERLGRYSAVPKTESGIVVEGVLKRSIGLTLEASGCQMPIGGHCRVEVEGGSFIEAEVVGFDGNRSFLMPTGDMTGMKANARVLSTAARNISVTVSDWICAAATTSSLEGSAFNTCEKCTVSFTARADKVPGTRS